MLHIIRGFHSVNFLAAGSPHVGACSPAENALRRSGL
jgi:hypothetical protein